ncbi:MAG: RodZ domain-containing protein [Cyanobacteria bacterium P01_D01_bin.1]
MHAQQTITQSLVLWSIVTKFSGLQQSQLAQIGAFLREKREQQGKSLQDIATNTYIRPQLLSGIETGNPELLPEPIFVQGFIRRYAETLGLKGVELSQQFTVDSIPSTPRPARTSAPEDSSTTRLTRLKPKAPSRQPEPEPAMLLNTEASDTDAADEVPVFTEAAAPFTPQPVTAAPVFESEAQGENFSEPDLALDSSLSNTSENIPVVPPTPERADDPNGFDFTNGSDPAIPQPNANRPEENNSVENILVEDNFAGNGSLQNGSEALSTIEVGTADSEAANSESASFETANIETANFETDSSETDSFEAEPSVRQTADEPSPFVSDLPLAKKAPASGQLTTPPISYTSSTSLGSDVGRDTPNLKPFAIGAVIVAALTAGIVVLANVLGGEPSPTVADSAAPVESVEPQEPASDLPTLPESEPEPAPPASDAPLFLEVEVTAPAWTTATADGGERLFEGTLNPGDSVIWEAQNSISVFSGNPGGLEISQNGQPAESLGESGIPSGRDYSVQ